MAPTDSCPRGDAARPRIWHKWLERTHERCAPQDPSPRDDGRAFARTSPPAR
eukprot:CAMPEP_0206058336 /NCGR_PEP_ID=MMETSP1466-20131121/46427_1 /ASSEMBLY_ACC=CAM_ASM_001126 /TAXON_ID=44452 /ORGANISM="Pavlova gyrans, Strain CCMP608" /LENGTH=51 /DNA_ID=CAMNT_0053433631 /DNA_START=105 /DNA_END=257 /DNA_ORIENTATION=+